MGPPVMSCLCSPTAVAQSNFSDSTELKCFLDHAKDSSLDLMKQKASLSAPSLPWPKLNQGDKQSSQWYTLHVDRLLGTSKANLFTHKEHGPH